MIQGAIFDLDGTLLDSMWIWDTIGQRYLESQGIQPPQDLTQRVRSMTLSQCAQYFHDQLGVSASPEDIALKVNQMVEEEYRYKLLLKPHAKEFLEKLKGQGVHMCVCTASDRPLVEAALERLGVLQLFDFVITCTEEGLGKDTPHLFERALLRLGTPKESTVIFEDALHAVESGVQGGFRVVVIADPSASGQEEALRALGEQYWRDYQEYQEGSL